MPARVTYPDSMEPLVQFIEETPRGEILDRTLEKLRAGVPIETMLTASALAVTRSSDLPPGHHGGPLHPVAGLYAISKLVQRLEGEDRFLPVLQHVALANKHVHEFLISRFENHIGHSHQRNILPTIGARRRRGCSAYAGCGFQ